MTYTEPGPGDVCKLCGHTELCSSSRGPNRYVVEIRCRHVSCEKVKGRCVAHLTDDPTYISYLRRRGLSTHSSAVVAVVRAVSHSKGTSRYSRHKGWCTNLHLQAVSVPNFAAQNGSISRDSNKPDARDPTRGGWPAPRNVAVQGRNGGEHPVIDVKAERSVA